jgi:hypothetical protein
MNAGTTGELTDELLVADTPVPVREVTDRRADNDVGGRIDPTKTWRLTMPMGKEARAKTDAPATVQLPALEATQ